MGAEISGVASVAAAAAQALTDRQQQQQQQHHRGGVAASDRTRNGRGVFGFNVNNGQLPFKVRRRKKRQPLGGVVGGDNVMTVGDGSVNQVGDGVRMTTRSTTAGAIHYEREEGESDVLQNRSSNNNNDKHQSLLSSSAENHKAFLRNYELNINSAAIKRMNSFKGQQQQRGQRQKKHVNEDKPAVAMINNENARILNVVSAISGRGGGGGGEGGGGGGHAAGEQTSYGEDNWTDEADEYYPSRDHLTDLQNLHMPFWDSYDSINQLYLEIGRGCLLLIGNKT